MNQKQTTNSLIVEVTAYISINLNNTWELIGFEPNSLDPIEVNGSSPKQTTLDDGMSPIGQMFKRIEEHNEVKRNHRFQSATQKALNRAQENPRHYTNRPSQHNWNGTIRKTQQCTVCGMEGVNRLTCLSHLNGGEKVHRKGTA